MSELKKNDNVVDFQNFARRKRDEKQLARGREPLFKTHAERSLTPEKGRRVNEGGFDERISKIRQSLDRISQLLFDLRKIAKKQKKDA